MESHKPHNEMQRSAKNVYSRELIDVLFSNPYCRIQFLVDKGIAKRQTAAQYLKTLSEIGLLEPVRQGREVYYLNRPLIQLLKQR